MYKRSISVLLFFAAEISALQRGARVRHDTRGNVSRPCDTAQLDYKFSRLQDQITEKSEKLHAELRETNHRLEVLEWHSTDVQTSLEQLSNDLSHLTAMGARNSGSPDKLDFQIDNLTKGLRVVVATLRVLTTDIGNLKENVTNIADATKSLFAPSHKDTFSPANRRRFPQDLPRNCKEVQERGNNVSGIYRIQPEFAPRAFMVLCDMQTSGGGWTFIHNRYEGVQDFYLNWRSYKLGFGNLGGEFWLGLEHLHQLTGYEVNELLVELADLEGNGAHAYYGAFSVGDEAEGYALNVLGGYQGDAGDSLMYHGGAKFSTKDVDQDEWAEGSCAQAHTGAWWYRACDHSNLNGQYLKENVSEDLLYHGMYWKNFHGPQYSLQRARMMIRPRGDPIPTLYSDENASK